MDLYQSVGIGSDFLGYRIEELIGRGGMGVVYRAYDLRLKRMVALKLVAPSLARDERFRERFARESELVMSLEHPNVVPIYDAGDVDGHIYLAMRLVDGTDLGSLLRTEGALEPDRGIAICTQIAAALDAAHERGLVHRDVKPSNVLLDGSEHVYLADFGLTRSLDDERGTVGEDRTVGTPAYLAPEQLEGRPVDGRADVYSLGCLLYECLTGEAVFPRNSRLAVAWAHLEEEPPRPSKQRAGLPEGIDAVIRRALAKEPGQRFATCGALVAAVQGALGMRGPTHRRGLVLAAGAGVVAVAAAVAIAIAIGGGRGSPAPPPTRANTLVRIDPHTQPASVVHDISVAAQPMAVATSGRTVWIYSQRDSFVSEVDAQTNRVLQPPGVLVSPPADLPLMGPVLAADSYGAWVVGRGRRGSGVLTLVSPYGGGREYPVGGRPVAVVTGLHAVWVLDDGDRHDRLLRLETATGRWWVQARLPASSHIDTLAIGFRHLWAVDSKTAILYRIDPRRSFVDHVRHVDLGWPRAGRPAALDGNIWVGVSGSGGGKTALVDPKTLVTVGEYDGAVDTGIGADSAGAFGSVWGFDVAAGQLERWDPPNLAPHGATPVTDAPYLDGSCMTSVAAGDGALWVTLAPSGAFACKL
jgi:serine/threonine-protein kinase